MIMYAKIEEMGGVPYIEQKKKEGYNAKETAELIGVSYIILYRYLQSKGLKWRDFGQSDKITLAGGIDYLINEKKKGKTQEQIALELGYSDSSPIRKYLSRRGYKWRDLEKGNRNKKHTYIMPKTNTSNKKYTSNLPLKKQLQSYGGVKFLEKKFREGYNLVEISEEFEWDYKYFAQICRELIVEAGVTKEELGYSEPRYRHYRLIDKEGGLPYFLESKIGGRSLEDIAGDFGLSHEVVKNYLKFKGVEWSDFFSVEGVYFIHHLGKWRGSFIRDGVVCDTVLCDTVWLALDEVRLLKEK